MKRETTQPGKKGRRVSKRKKDLWKGFKNRTTDHRPTAKQPRWRLFEKRDIRSPDIKKDRYQSIVNRIQNRLKNRR